MTNDEHNLYVSNNQGFITVFEKSGQTDSQSHQCHSKTYLKSLLVDDDFLYGGSIWTDCTVGVYDKKTLDVLEILEGPLGTIFCLVSADSFLFSGAGDSRVDIWNKADWSLVGTVSGQRHFILSLVIDSDFIYAGGIDDCTNVFSRKTLDQVASLEGHNSNILALAVDDDFLYSGSGELWWGGPGSPRPAKFESSIRVWQKKDWSCVSVLEGHTDNVNAISLDNEFVYSISDDASFRVYSKKDWTEILCVQVSALRIDALTIDETAIYLGCSDGSIRQLLKSDIEN
ncbi:MAG: WD40 repeat domain-containing protein [Candidatus Thorarchaeota archaeon]